MEDDSGGVPAVDTTYQTAPGGAHLRTFLIADIRGYTRFTREFGDGAAAQLATRFADVARDVVEARSGSVIELRGDEALAVFSSSAQAARASIELQAACAEETARDPALPLPVGIGIDVGEAVPVEGGFRGVALNMAARLCSRAAAGEILVTTAIAESVGGLPDLAFRERAAVELKGFEGPVQVWEVVPGEGGIASRVEFPSHLDPIPVELDPLIPLVDRERELRWLRGTWRQSERGNGRLVVISGPAGIGKTRLVAELASYVHARGGVVRYTGPGGAGAALAQAAIRDTSQTSFPTLLVVDDLAALGGQVVAGLEDAAEAISHRPVMVVVTVRQAEDVPELSSILARADQSGDAHRVLGALDMEAVAGIARIYVGDDLEAVPLESMARGSGGNPGRAHELISQWAREEAKRRLAAAAEYLAAGRDQHRTQLDFANNVIGLKLGRLYGVEEVLEGDLCPYKGLASFEAEDAAYFFGRERLVGELAARSVGSGLLGVVGPSGSGKSSAVLAGMLPSLAAGLLPGSERWVSLTIRPGDRPMTELEAALASVRPPERLVVVVDQFEEVFATSVDEGERQAFVQALIERAADPERAVVVLTIRADFYGHCAEFPDLAELLGRNHVLVGPMSDEELRRAIELPARRVGLRVESALTDVLATEVADQPGALPLLSTALVELWQERDGGWLRVESHARTGGVRGAVARLAEASFEHLAGVQREVARAILLRLVGQGEGDAAVRRRVPLTEFDQRPEVYAVLARFTEDRLITRSGDLVEVAHEALIREWPRLRGWLEEDVQGQQIRRHVTQSASQWDERGRDEADLYRGARLSVTLEWAAAHGRELNELEREFLSESRRASERQADRQRRINRRLRALLAGVAVSLVVALVGGALALVQRSRAQQEARVATAQRVGAQALLEDNLDRSLLLARTAVELNDTVETRSDLLAALLRSPRAVGILHGDGDRLLSLDLSSGGETLAIGDNNGTVIFFDPATGTRIGEPLETTNRAANILFLSLSPHGDTAAVVASDGTAGIWDVRTQRRIDGPPGLDAEAPFPPFFEYLDDGRLAVFETTGRIFLWNPASGRRSRPITLPFPDSPEPPSPAFSPDGRAVALATPEGTTIYDLRTGEASASTRFTGHPLGFSSDGGLLAIGGRDGSVRVIDVGSGRSREMSGRHQAAVQSVAFSRDGGKLVSTGDDSLVMVWDVASGASVETLRGHAGRVITQAISADGTTLYTGSLDSSVILWDLAGDRSLGRPFMFPGNEFALGAWFSPDGGTLAVVQGEREVRIIDTERGVPVGSRIISTNEPIYSMTMSPDGRLVATAGAQALELWDASTGQEVASVPTERDLGEYATVRFRPDGRLLAVGTGNEDWTEGHVATFGVPDLEKLSAWQAGQGVNEVGFSPDGTRLVTAVESGEVAAWRVRDHAQLWSAKGDITAALSAAYSPDGKVVAAGGLAGQTALLDARTGRPIGPRLTGHAGYVISASFDPTSSTLATGSTDGTVLLYDVASGKQLGSALTGPGNIWVVARFSPNSKDLAAVYQNGRGFLWDIQPASWKARACSVAGRSLTLEEWRQFVPEYPYQRVCPRGR